MKIVLIANENVDHASMLVCNYYGSKKEVTLFYLLVIHHLLFISSYNLNGYDDSDKHH